MDQLYPFFLFIVSAKYVLSNDILPNTHDPSDSRHYGNLYFVDGEDVVTLAWTVKIKSHCPDFSNSSIFTFNTTRHENKCDVDLHLFIIKKIAHFTNTFLMAHPYYSFLHKVRKKHREKYKKSVLLNSIKYKYTNSTKRNNYILDRRKYDSMNSSLHLFMKVSNCVNYYLQATSCVAYSQQQVSRRRVKRSRPHFVDPLYDKQWHLHNKSNTTYSINVAGAWDSGVTGEGVTVCVIDDGLEWSHPDIKDNYNKYGSYDLNADDPDPSPAHNGEANEHGTRCAGEIAGVPNDVCGVGVAFKASLSAIRVLGGRMTDSMEASAFSHGLQHNHIYSCSWGPADDGKSVDGPHRLAKSALVWGTRYGRNGRGAIYVVASGNGGNSEDDCNFDGYANSIYTVTVGAVDQHGNIPYYAEKCSAMLAVAPSSGSDTVDIVTTDWHGNSPSGCTEHHTGTSAAAPLAAGVIALALQTQPCLGWKDVQYLLVISSKVIRTDTHHWVTNKAGFQHSNTLGFGLIDASSMVSAAAVWETLPYDSKFVGPLLEPPVKGIDEGKRRHFTYQVTESLLESFALRVLESVEVRVWLTHNYRGSLVFSLICPSGTKSPLADARTKDKSVEGLKGWSLVSVRCWAENPFGNYTLIVEGGSKIDHTGLKGSLDRWQLILHGNSASPKEVKLRIDKARQAMSGVGVHISNRSRLCHPPAPPFYAPYKPIPFMWLNIFLFVGIAAILTTLISAVEYAFCNAEEKTKFKETLEQIRKAKKTFSSKRRENQSTCIQIDESKLALLDMRPGSQSPTQSCDADQSASNDEFTDCYDKDETTSVHPHDTSDHNFTTTDHIVTTTDHCVTSSNDEQS